MHLIHTAGILIRRPLDTREVLILWLLDRHPSIPRGKWEEMTTGGLAELVSLERDLEDSRNKS